MKKLFTFFILLISISAKATGIEDVVNGHCFGPPHTKAITDIILWMPYILGSLLFLKLIIVGIKKYKATKNLITEQE
jgi:hypothetical protein